MSVVDGRIVRTLSNLADYNFEIHYIKESHNKVADTLSRAPAEFDTDEHLDTLPLLEALRTSAFIPEGLGVTVVHGEDDTLPVCLFVARRSSQQSYLH